jgi:hypothetical protein
MATTKTTSKATRGMIIMNFKVFPHSLFKERGKGVKDIQVVSEDEEEIER